MGIGETLHWALPKTVMRAAGYQAMKACGNLQLCAGLKAGIERATHAVVKRRLEKSRVRNREKYTRRPAEEEESYSVVVGVDNISIETAGLEEEAAEGLEAAIRLEIVEDGAVEGEG